MSKTSRYVVAAGHSFIVETNGIAATLNSGDPINLDPKDPTTAARLDAGQIEETS